MTVVRRAAAATAVAALAACAGVLPAAPAAAHGATTLPVSRTAACARGSAVAGSAACRAALAVNRRPFGSFDNLRVPGVAGRDRQVIPDGTLCSGNLPPYAGLDLPRDDWPATRLTAGATIRLRYATTIPHRGTFRVYLTRPGYDPAAPLSWDDLDERPIVTVTDPPLRGGAYRFAGTLPPDRAGRHLLYVVWQNSSTPDTYYSCSDVVLEAPEPARATVRAGTPASSAPPPEPRTTAASRPPGRGAAAAPVRSPEPGAVAAPADVVGSGGDPGGPPARESWLSRVEDDRIPPGRQMASATLIVVAGVALGLAVTRMRRGGRHRDRGFEKR